MLRPLPDPLQRRGRRIYQSEDEKQLLKNNFMTNQIVIDQLPESIRTQVMDYANYLITKYYTDKKQKKKHPKAGCMKGIVKYIAKDFDAPLEDFKDYM